MVASASEGGGSSGEKTKQIKTKPSLGFIAFFKFEPMVIQNTAPQYDKKCVKFTQGLDFS